MTDRMPWDERWVPTDNGGVHVLGDPVDEVVQTDSGVYRRKPEDCHLLAASPELYQALKSLLECAQPDTDARAVIRVSYRTVEECRALLRKARGT